MANDDITGQTGVLKTCSSRWLHRKPLRRKGQYARIPSRPGSITLPATGRIYGSNPVPVIHDTTLCNPGGDHIRDDERVDSGLRRDDEEVDPSLYRDNEGVLPNSISLFGREPESRPLSFWYKPGVHFVTSLDPGLRRCNGLLSFNLRHHSARVDASTATVLVN